MSTTLQQRLEQIRAETGLSWSEMARRSGLNRSSFCRVANGRHHGITPNTARQMGSGLGYRAAWILLGSGSPQPDPADTCMRRLGWITSDGQERVTTILGTAAEAQEMADELGMTVL